MIEPITTKINSQGHLEVGGCDTVDLAKKFGTPLYILDEETIRANCKAYTKAFDQNGLENKIIFASKALSVVSVLRLINSENLGVDVSSGGEIFTALKAGCSPKNIYFHGSNKTEKELEYAIKSKIGRIVVDNYSELETIESLSKKFKTKVHILIRVNPGIEAHTHDYIKTAKVDSKFGLSRQVVIDMLGYVKESKYVEFVGIHSHIGSQIFDVGPFKEEARFLMEMSAEILDRHGLICQEINIGGGIGIQYQNDDNPASIETFGKLISSAIIESAKKLGLSFPKVIIEPGRSIVGSAGVTLYSVGSVKDIEDIRKYVLVDGGMSDNPRPILYSAKYTAVVANKAAEPKNDVVTVGGRFCESGDVLIRDITLQSAQAGDILAVFSTGAYNYSMASNYNRVPRPAMVIVNKGRARLIVRRESYKDLVRNDL